MRKYGHKRRLNFPCAFRSVWPLVLLSMPLLGSAVRTGRAQVAAQDSVSQQVQQLNAAMARAEAQIEESQRQLSEMRRQLAALQVRMAGAQSNTQAPSSSAADSSSSPSSTNTPEANAADIQDLRERQAIQTSQIATHEQTKVESESKYPVKVTGLLLLNGFVNTGAVDMPSTPTVAVGGSGSTGASVRQTVLGVDAYGPHLFGARSYADLRVDFDGNPQNGGTAEIYTGYYNSNTTLLRLRTAHTGLQWDSTSAYFSLDRPLFSPDSPASLAAVAEPPLAWSGNLWTWNPQLGLTHDLAFVGSHSLRLQAALMDVGDAPVSPVAPSSADPSVMQPSASEQSRWPGVEARIAVLGSKQHETGNHFGVGGYFAPHLTSFGRRFDSWAATADTRLLLPAHLEFTTSFYRGLGLGGLGGGGYKDFVYRTDPDTAGYYFRPLDDVGGWAELKEKFSERIELNAAFGMDNVFARELRPYATPGPDTYHNLARNRTYTGNVIYSPSAYLLFSLEYRHLDSSPVLGPSTGTNIIGLAAGYKF
jgi:hypothetical protein